MDQHNWFWHAYICDYYWALHVGIPIETDESQCHGMTINNNQLNHGWVLSELTTPNQRGSKLSKVHFLWEQHRAQHKHSLDKYPTAWSNIFWGARLLFTFKHLPLASSRQSQLVVRLLGSHVDSGLDVYCGEAAACPAAIYIPRFCSKVFGDCCLVKHGQAAP